MLGYSIENLVYKLKQASSKIKQTWLWRQVWFMTFHSNITIQTIYLRRRNLLSVFIFQLSINWKFVLQVQFTCDKPGYIPINPAPIECVEQPVCKVRYTTVILKFSFEIIVCEATSTDYFVRPSVSIYRMIGSCLSRWPPFAHRSNCYHFWYNCLFFWLGRETFGHHQR